MKAVLLYIFFGLWLFTIAACAKDSLTSPTDNSIEKQNPIDTVATDSKAIQLSKRSVLTMSFTNTINYEDGCEFRNAGYVHSNKEKIKSAFKKSLHHAHLLGINCIVYDHFNNDVSRARISVLSEAIKEFNIENDSKIALAPLFEYADQSIIESVYQSIDETVRAEIDGHPLVACWTTSTDYEKWESIPAGIKAVTGKTAELWVWFHFMDVNKYNTIKPYFDNWKEAGASKIGVFSFYSGNAGYWSVQRQLKPLCDEDDVRYVPGIPTARGVASGDNICGGSRGLSYFTDLKGYHTMLTALHDAADYLDNIGSKPVDFLMATLGFAGDYGENVFLEPVRFCDEFDDYNRNMGRCKGELNQYNAATPSSFFKSNSILVWTHRGYYKIAQPFIEWFKTKHKPALTPDKQFIAWAYRQHPLLMPAPSGDLNPAQAEIKVTTNSLDNKFWGDKIYVTSWLLKPGILKITLGGVTSVDTIPANQIFIGNGDEWQSFNTEYSTERQGYPLFEFYQDINGDGKMNELVNKWGDGVDNVNSNVLEISTIPRQVGDVISRNPFMYADFRMIEN